MPHGPGVHARVRKVIWPLPLPVESFFLFFPLFSSRRLISFLHLSDELFLVIEIIIDGFMTESSSHMRCIMSGWSVRQRNTKSQMGLRDTPICRHSR